MGDSWLLFLAGFVFGALLYDVLCSRRRESKPPELLFSSISLKDGDCLIASTPGYLSNEARASVKRNLESAFVGSRVFVMEGGMRLAVINKERAATSDTNRSQPAQPPEPT